jgi:hypothetical protein
MDGISPAWRRALSEGPLRSATFWCFFLFQVSIIWDAISLIVSIVGTATPEMTIVMLVLVLGLIGYGFWLVLQAYQDARAVVGTEHEEILARYSYLTAKMYFLAEGCTVLCLRVAESLVAR